jgi:3'-5' exonuclease
MSEFFFDIETQRTGNAALIKAITAGVKPPGSYKKPETIQKWWAEEGPEAVQEAVNRTALDGTYGRIASFAWAIGDQPVKAVYGPDERVILEVASDVFVHAFNPVAFNGEFDVRFLWQRMIVNHVIIPERLPSPNSRDGWYDPMREWAGYRGYIKQTDLELALGITRETDITGADVGDAIDCGDWETVGRHNSLDVENLRLIYRRMTR